MCLPLDISVLEGGAGALFPFILCGSIGEFVANCEAVTAFVFRVPVLLLVMLPLALLMGPCPGAAIPTATGPLLIWKRMGKKFQLKQQLVKSRI